MEFGIVSPRQLSMGLFLEKWIWRDLKDFIVYEAEKITTIPQEHLLMDYRCF